MAFTGIVQPIPLGQGGIHTDDSPNTIPATDLILANNVTMHNNYIEKDAGSTRFNTSAVPSGVYGAFDWWPTTNLSDRRLIVLGGDGKIYAIDDTGAATEITASGGAPATLTVTNQVYFVTGGNEAAGNAKKLFIMNGSNPVQVISGTGTTRTNLATPPAEWVSGKQPRFGAIVEGRLALFGSDAAPHTLYLSRTDNHETLTGSGTLQFPVYPGEGERLTSGFIMGGRFYMLKYPSYAYGLITDNADNTQWYVRKATAGFGAATPHAVVPTLNDVLVKTAEDSVLSILAVQEFGDVKAGDVFNILRMEQFVRDSINTSGALLTHSLYYPEKKLAYFTFKSTLGSSNDRMMLFRLDTQGKPKASFITKDAPNCLALRKDSNGVLRPIYGSLDGYVYLMDQEDRNVAGAAYVGEFQTPHMDFGFRDQKLAEINKNFVFLELRYVPKSDCTIYADTFIDGNYYDTYSIQMRADAVLGDTLPDTNDFMLADSANDPEGSFLAGEDLATTLIPIAGMGRSISIRIYNSGLNETFKIASLFIGFKPSGQQQR